MKARFYNNLVGRTLLGETVQERSIKYKMVQFKISLIASCISIFIILLLVGCQKSNADLSEKIIKKIDNSCENNNICMIRIKDITNFKWDKVVIFRLGSSNTEVSKALGFEYKGSTDLMSGMIFVLNNKVVRQELYPYYPERHSRISITESPDKPSCVCYTYEEATLLGSKEGMGGKFYYHFSY